MMALRVEQLRSGYSETEIVHGVSLDSEEGKICALMGKNGAGKTTLLRTVVGLVPLWTGRVEIFGRDVSSLPTHRIVGRDVAYAPQEEALFQDLSVAENLRLGAVGHSRAEFERLAERVLTLFPILGRRRNQRAGTLSGGEQGMLRMARCLLPEPRLVLLDEISEGLGPAVLNALSDALLHERATRGITILLVEQNLDFAFGLASKFVLIERGAVLSEVTSDSPTAREQVARHLAL